jgi:hypothetical protein
MILRPSSRSSRSQITRQIGHSVRVDAGWLKWRTRRRRQASEIDGTTAQTIYDGLVKDALSPRLRALGFKGSGGRYELPSSECWALASFQKSTYSDAAEVQFTLNLLVVKKAAWASAGVDRPNLPERPSAGVLYGAPALQSRIGSLTPDASDKWWRVYDGMDGEALAADVLHDVTMYALPWLRDRLAEVESQ